MSQHIYEYPCSYVISPHVMSKCLDDSMASWSKSIPLRSPAWEYFEIVDEKKVRCTLCVPPAATTLCVCVHVCVCSCVHVWMHASVCVCVHQIFGIRSLRMQLFEKQKSLFISALIYIVPMRPTLKVTGCLEFSDFVYVYIYATKTGILKS